jgi:hypothetical protein
VSPHDPQQDLAIFWITEGFGALVGCAAGPAEDNAQLLKILY